MSENNKVESMIPEEMFCCSEHCPFYNKVSNSCISGSPICKKINWVKVLDGFLVDCGSGIYEEEVNERLKHRIFYTISLWLKSVSKR